MKTIFLLLCASILHTSNSHASDNFLNFDGVNDYVDINSIAPSMTGLTRFSVEFLFNVKEPQVRQYGMFFSINGALGSSDDNKLLIRLAGPGEGTGNSVVVNAPFGGSLLLIGGVNVLDSNCHHVAYTYNSGTHSLYIDGALQGTITKTLTLVNTDRYSLGQEYDNNVTSDFLTGSMDEIRIWNTVRTATEINDNRFSQLVGNETGLINYFNCNQGISAGNNTLITSLTNTISPSRNGTLVNFQLLSNTSNFRRIEGCRKIISQSNWLNFDGINDYVNINAIASSMSGLNQYSVDFLIDLKNLQKSPYGMFFSINAAPGGTDINKLLIRLAGTGEGAGNSVVVNAPFGGSLLIIGGVNVLDGNCHHVAYTYNSGTHSLYIDGILQGTMTKTVTLVSTDRYSLGQEYDDNTTSDFLTGSMDEIRIWNTTRTTTEIYNNMGNELTGNEIGLINYFNCNQGIPGGNNTLITSLTNIISPSRDGTLVNFQLLSNTSNFVAENCKRHESITTPLHKQQTKTNNNMAVFPNPATDFIYFTLESGKQYEVIIYDLPGNIIYKNYHESTENKIDTKKWINGTYIIKILSGENNIDIRKIIVAH
ncbi:T9SS type A sorting domain-containing protein [Crocinitomicaceae bacterium CZZ-1]|uniref:T9SS type A sorting domain-containing protein n=1 Tax=Taishania pollutisoli TaxID=2766479 RepID=A0A8J6TTS3_9FLAO|nr:LamG-like jellyroll fold domain-containing protein [Taishania pollutisoli]MBC9813284.1 T9SS type A sorting domain-containing protein [Taishania pollutisoli]